MTAEKIQIRDVKKGNHHLCSHFLLRIKAFRLVFYHFQVVIYESDDAEADAQ